MKEWPVTQYRLECILTNYKNSIEDTNVLNLPTEEEVRDGWYLVVKERK